MCYDAILPLFDTSDESACGVNHCFTIDRRIRSTTHLLPMKDAHIKGKIPDNKYPRIDNDNMSIRREYVRPMSNRCRSDCLCSWW